MSGSTNVLFGGLPLNVAISQPVLNGGVTTPSSPCAGTGGSTPPSTGSCGCHVTPSNGIGEMVQAQNPFPVVALAGIAAFSAVVFGAGGVQHANLGVPQDRDRVIGLTVNSPLAGQIANVAWGGPVVNTLLGTGGWNFVVNGPVYVGTDGVLTQTPPTSGWVRQVGIAIAANTVMLDLSQTQPSSATGEPLVMVVPTSAAPIVDFDDADVFDFTLADPTLITFTGGVDGRTVTLRIKQDSTGGNALTFGPKIIDGDNVASNIPLAGNGYAIADLQYDAATDKYILKNLNVISAGPPTP